MGLCTIDVHVFDAGPVFDGTQVLRKYSCPLPGLDIRCLALTRSCSVRVLRVVGGELTCTQTDVVEARSRRQPPVGRCY